MRGVEGVTTAALDPFAAITEGARLAAWAELAARGPVVRTVLPNGVPAWLVTGQAECRAALGDERFTKSGTPVSVVLAKVRPHLVPAVATHMLRVDGPDHQRLRRLVAAAFTRRPMEALDDHIREITAALLDDLMDRQNAYGVVDLLAEFAYPLPMTVICEMLGLPDEHRPPFRELTATVAGGAFVSEEELGNAVDRLVELLRLLVALKREAPAADLISALVAVRDGGDRLSEDELTSMIFLLVVAGHETTVNLLANGVSALFANPDQLARLRAQPALIGTAVEELLRYCSPLQVTFPAVAGSDTDLGGVAIAAGEVLVPVLLTANRDPARVADPDGLDLAREPNHHVAFGHGAHHCLGAPLARLEARIALPALLDRYPDLELAVAPEALTWRPNFLFNGLDALPVRLGAPSSNQT